MAIDYQTLQVSAAELPPTRDAFCPDCGQPLTTLGFVGGADPAPRPWWSWLVGALGIYLVIVSGQLTWNDDQLVVHTRASLGSILFAAQDMEAGSPAQQLLTEATARLGRDLLADVGGLALVLVGFGTREHPRLRSDHPPQQVVARALAGLWRAGKTLIVSLLGVGLIVFGYILVSKLVQGETFSLALVETTIRRTVDLILFAAAIVLGNPGP